VSELAWTIWPTVSAEALPSYNNPLAVTPRMKVFDSPWGSLGFCTALLLLISMAFCSQYIRGSFALNFS